MSARPETRARIFAAAQRLSYVPNGFARGLRRSRTMTIGVVLPNLAYAVNAEIIRGAERRAAWRGYVVLVADAMEFGPTSTAYQRLLMEGRVDGLLIASATTAEGATAALSTLPLPVVLSTAVATPRGERVVDDEYGIGLAVDRLVGLGHHRIAYVAGPSDADTALRRRAGFRARMRTTARRPGPADDRDHVYGGRRVRGDGASARQSRAADGYGRRQLRHRCWRDVGRGGGGPTGAR